MDHLSLPVETGRDMSRAKEGIKRSVERLLVGSRIPRSILRKPGRGVLILAYHNIVPEGESPVGDRSLHLPQRNFAEQLDRLLETHTVVPLDQLLAPETETSRPRAVLTFDDAYLGALTAGLEELESRGLPATVFVNPGALDWEGFWWDRLADPVTGILPEAVRGHALDALGGRQMEILSWAATTGLDLHPLPEYARAAPLPHLRSVAASPVVALGSHSWSHPCLRSLSEKELNHELASARDWLAQHFSSVCGWISYPYGHHSKQVERGAARYHEGGLRVSGGIARAGDFNEPDRYRVPRINVPSGVTGEGFILRLAGMVS
jgi:peptidoglycan/xylan/chitin deacetylase (PgdA/CDA1 family)